MRLLLILAGLTSLSITGLHAGEGKDIIVRVRDVSASDNKLPPVLNVALQHDGYDARLPESLRLVRNNDVHVTKFEEDGVLRPGNVDPNNVGFYSDPSQHAVITAKLRKKGNRIVRTLQGSFGRRNRRYKIEPDVQSLETKRHVDNNLEFDDHDHIVRKLNEAAGNTNKDFPYADTNIDEEDPVNVNLRSTTPYYVVEMFWLVDSQFYKTWKDMYIDGHGDEQLDEFLYHLINGVQYAYSSLAQCGFDLRVLVKKITIAKQGGAYNNPELPTDVASKYTNNSDLDGVVVLHEMREYRKKMNYTWYNPDALLMITGYNLDLLGRGYRGGICWSSLGCSVAQVTGWESWVPISHELGHNLGMYHDGKMNGCSKDDYIMGPKVVQFHRLKNVSTGFTFSPCSCKQAKAVVEGTNTKGHKLPRVCLKNTTCNIEFQGQSNRQAALIHSYDEQCYFKMKIYADNSKCPGFKWNDPMNCVRLWCRLDYEACMLVNTIADGTICGRGKWCIKGKCVDRSGTPELQPINNCTENGGIPQPAPGCTDKGNFCAEHPADVCKYAKTQCCKTCTQYGL